MKLLYILRHGKSSAAPPGGPDHDRPLAERGIRESRAVGAECARRGWHPAHALVSSARRTRETFENFAASHAGAGGPPIAEEVDSALYLASPDSLRDALAVLGTDAPSVLLVGHNPGLQELSLWLAGKGPSKRRDRLARDFPTGTLAVFQCDIDDWADLRPRHARLDHLTFARDLDQS
jgi:phosphohistidine phosphatase